MPLHAALFSATLFTQNSETAISDVSLLDSLRLIGLNIKLVFVQSYSQPVRNSSKKLLVDRTC